MLEAHHKHGKNGLVSHEMKENLTERGKLKRLCYHLKCN